MRADEIVVAEEGEAEARAAQAALDRSLAALPSDDRLIVRLHFLEAMSVADIARALAVPQKPLYRRLQRSLQALRSGMERSGISREYVRELVTGPP